MTMYTCIYEVWAKFFHPKRTVFAKKRLTFAKLSRSHRGAGLCYWPRSRSRSSRSRSFNKPNLSVEGWGLGFRVQGSGLGLGFKSRNIQGLAVPSAMDWFHYFTDMTPNNSQHAHQMCCPWNCYLDLRQISSPEKCFRIPLALRVFRRHPGSPSGN